MSILTEEQWRFMMKRLRKDISKKQRARLEEAIKNARKIKEA